MPTALNATQPISKAARKAPRDLTIGLILALGMLASGARPANAAAGPAVEPGDDTPANPPVNLAKLVAHRETETEAERDQYTYRQSVTLDELDGHGAARGQYRETRDIIFSPKHERSENLLGRPENGLKNLILTEEDFHDIREIQPLVLTEERLWIYETKVRGEEKVDDVDCWVLQVRPRQILQGQRLFDGTIWVDQKEYNIVRMEGQAVPQIRTTKQENLFPRFTTIRKPIDGAHWFPVYTYADDTLFFRGGPQRERLRIAYTNYKRFGVESTFTPK